MLKKFKNKLFYFRYKHIKINKSGIMDSANNPKIIVSLTTFPARVPTLHITLKSLLLQSFKPNIIILQLSEEDFPNKENDLPNNILELTKYGITINWNKDNIKSYKKLIPTLTEYPNDIIITVDDDLIYDKNLVKYLWQSYVKNPKFIHCHRTTKISFFNNNVIAEPQKYYDTPSFANKLVGCGGCLYPPNSLYADITNKDLFLELAPTNDDIWFWLMAVMNNTKIKIIKNHISKPIEIQETKNGPCLCHINDKGEKLFYKDLDNVLKHYNGLKEKIANDITQLEFAETRSAVGGG